MSEPSTDLQHLIQLIQANRTADDLALGYLRYETVRRMVPRDFYDVYQLSLTGKTFDDLVDEALSSWRKTT